MAAKEYTIIKTRGRTGVQTKFTGTLEKLTEDFSYTLQCGNSWNPKINRNPRTISSLVNNLNRSIAETQRGSYTPDDYILMHTR